MIVEFARGVILLEMKVTRLKKETILWFRNLKRMRCARERIRNWERFGNTKKHSLIFYLLFTYPFLPYRLYDRSNGFMFVVTNGSDMFIAYKSVDIK